MREGHATRWFLIAGTPDWRSNTRPAASRMLCRKKNIAGHGGRRVLTGLNEVLQPILLDARGAQPGEAVLIDRVLPGEEFFDRQGVARAGLFKRQQATAHSRNDFGLAPDDPT